jgi:hypothetical protein
MKIESQKMYSMFLFAKDTNGRAQSIIHRPLASLVRGTEFTEIIFFSFVPKAFVNK